MSESKKTTDYTKTKAYAWIDLTTKVLTSFALVVLGMAGWTLQSRTEDARRKAEAFDRQQRRYLPELRSLSLLELELERLILLPKLYEKPYPSSGDNLRIKAKSLYLPDGDPIVLVRSFGPGSMRDPKEFLQQMEIPLRAFTLLCSEMIELHRAVHNEDSGFDLNFIDNSSFVFIQESHIVAVSNNLNRWIGITVDSESLPLWEKFCKRNPKPDELSPDLIDAYLGSLRFAVSGTLQDVLNKHPELGDRYVQIREEVEKNFNPSIAKSSPTTPWKATAKRSRQ